jgi:hypothetical protein
MVLAAGSELIEDVRKAPDDVLSTAEPTIEVRLHAKWSAHAHKDYLVP